MIMISTQSSTPTDVQQLLICTNHRLRGLSDNPPARKLPTEKSWRRTLQSLRCGTLRTRSCLSPYQLGNPSPRDARCIARLSRSRSSGQRSSKIFDRGERNARSEEEARLGKAKSKGIKSSNWKCSYDIDKWRWSSNASIRNCTSDANGWKWPFPGLSTTRSFHISIMSIITLSACFLSLDTP
jgi:hypothetical protein